MILYQNVEEVLCRRRLIKRGKRNIEGLSGGDLVFVCSLACCLFFWLTIGDVRKCTDEEHITYSGGKEIFDLLQCG